jgi:F0F1-type ATP synthase assembly protein I
MSDLTPPRPGNEAPAAAPARTSGAARAVVSAAAGTTVDPFARQGYARDTNRGYGDAMGRGFELALTFAVMTGLGWVIDRAAGTSPVFIIALSVVGFAGIAVKLKLGYDLEMAKHDTPDAVWNRGSGEGEAVNEAPVPTDHSGAASAVADALAAEARRASEDVAP